MNFNAWNLVTDRSSMWFGLKVWVLDPVVFPSQDADHVSVLIADDAPVRQFHVSMFK